MRARAGCRMRVIASLVLTAFSMTALADASNDVYPSRPITLIVPWGAGGGADQMGRKVATLLEAQLKSASVPVINVPGASGNNGIVKLIRGNDADGYSLAVLVQDTYLENVLAKGDAPWKMSEITPIALMNRQPFAYFVAADSPFKTWKQIQEVAKIRELKIAIDGLGNSEDLLVRYLRSKGLKLTPVPFEKPGERYAALLGHHVDIMCEPDGNVRGYIDGQQFRPVLVFSTKRVPVPQMEDVPTANESGYDVALGAFRVIVAKAGTSPEVLALLQKALAQVFQTRQFQEFLDRTWSDKDSYASGETLSKFLKSKQEQIESFAVEARHTQ